MHIMSCIKGHVLFQYIYLHNTWNEILFVRTIPGWTTVWTMSITRWRATTTLHSLVVSQPWWPVPKERTYWNTKSPALSQPWWPVPTERIYWNTKSPALWQPWWPVPTERIYCNTKSPAFWQPWWPVSTERTYWNTK